MVVGKKFLHLRYLLINKLAESLGLNTAAVLVHYLDNVWAIVIQLLFELKNVAL